MEGSKRQRYTWNVDCNMWDVLQELQRGEAVANRGGWGWGVPGIREDHRALEVVGALPWLVTEVMAWMVAQVALSAGPELELVVLDVARSFDAQRVATIMRAAAKELQDANERLRRVSIIACSSLCEVTCSALLLKEQMRLEPQRPRMVFLHGLYNHFWESKHIAKVRQTAPLPQGRCLDMVATLANALALLVRHKESNITVVMSRYHMFGASGKDSDSSFLRNQWSSMVSMRLQVEPGREPNFVMSCVRPAASMAAANDHDDDDGQHHHHHHDTRSEGRIHTFRLTLNGIDWDA